MIEDIDINKLDEFVEKYMKLLENGNYYTVINLFTDVSGQNLILAC